MFRTLGLLCLLATPSWAATLITVAQSQKNPNGTLASGYALIRISLPCRSGTDYVGDKTIRVDFTGGAFSVPLVANSDCVPANTYYTVQWYLTGGTMRQQNWKVRSDLGSTVTVDSVIQGAPPGPSFAIQPSQIAQGGATVGQAFIWNGSGWVPGNVTLATCLHTVTYSATPAFDFSTCTQLQITLTGNVAPTIVHPELCEVPGGCTVTFIQGVGSYTVTWPGSVTGGFAIGTTSGGKNVQSFTSDGSGLNATGYGSIQ